ncbi:acid-sensing ion channel 1-like, partial [Paramuricea clavata]
MDECNKVHSLPENDKENNGKGKQMSVRTIISDYGERTTFHGFRYFILGGSFIRQLIWLGLILCSFAYFTFNGIRLFTNFLNFPTMTKNEIITKQMMLFPAITVCNYNPVKKSKLQAVHNYANSRTSSVRGQSEGEETNDNGIRNLTKSRGVDIDKIYQKYGHRMDEDGMFVS